MTGDSGTITLSLLTLALGSCVVSVILGCALLRLSRNKSADSDTGRSK